ncbi:MAG: NACHT domain-containing protein [Lachnospiraceae bacterium]|nr:NACHT domain-containing protein [Lachnospiraceae bacterium]
MNIPAILKELTKVGVVALTEKSVETFVETKIKPIFENWGKEESRSIELEECLSEYLLRCYGKNNIMTTIVFGRLQKTLEDLYIPLTLEEYRNENREWIVNENCYDILDNYSRILIIDMAGMGKSTIVKYFACQGVNLDKCIPVVIELRRLEKKQTILEYIQKQINSYDKNIEIGEIVDMLKKGDFVIFFDGYDEIANENKSDVLEAIQEFTNRAYSTKIVITSREEDDLNSLGEYKCVNIKPLTKKEAYTLIRKYDNDGVISKKLIKRLKEDSSMDILSEFLENPLLVSLLYKTFEYKEEIPYKKIGFYQQVYEALFNDHDKTKGGAYVHEKKTKLDKYQFEQILRAFGFLCLKVDKVEYSSQLIHELLAKAIDRFSWLKINVDDFLYDITHAVSFIQIDGNEYKWVHKTFMEYFASCFICYDNKVREEEYFNKMVYANSGINYYNVLSFCYDMDVLGFRKYAIMPYLKKFIEMSERLKGESILCDNKKMKIY